MVHADDFSLTTVLPEGPGSKGASKGMKRPWLKAFETAPGQMLNTYGLAKYSIMSNEEVWGNVTQPLKSGAEFMTEYASKEAERRGIGINRWLKSLYDYLEYQRTAEQKKKNKFILKETVYDMFYAEIDKILPSVEYCLAPKKVAVSSGAASLRSSAAPAQAPVSAKSPVELDRHAEVLFKFVDPTEVSRIRMMLNFQGGGGLPYCASVHHLVTQCFRQYGNKKHQDDATVSVSEFQAAIKERHRIGDSGITIPGASTAVDDYM
jgi:hypothetical protein